MKHTMQLAEKSAYSTATAQIVFLDECDAVRTSGDPKITDAGTTLDWLKESDFN